MRGPDRCCGAGFRRVQRVAPGQAGGPKALARAAPCRWEKCGPGAVHVFFFFVLFLAGAVAAGSENSAGLALTTSWEAFDLLADLDDAVAVLGDRHEVLRRYLLARSHHVEGMGRRKASAINTSEPDR